MGLEKNFQAEALKYLNSLPGCRAENVSGNAKQSGRPDINGCYRGRMFKIELKVPDNKNSASKKQSYELQRWYRAGAAVGVIYSIEALKGMMASLIMASLELYKNKSDYTQREVHELNGCTSWYRF